MLAITSASASNARSVNKRRRNNGCGCRSCRHTNTTKTTAPPPSKLSVKGSDHAIMPFAPTVPICCKPYTNDGSPMSNSAPPIQSIVRSTLRASRGRAIAVSATAPTATGTFSQNTHGHPMFSTINPPSAGPIAMNTSGIPT